MGRKKKAPKAPDFTKLAEQTAASNRQAQTTADFANRPTINTPYGSQEWISSLGVDPATGQKITNWTQNTRLNPLAQRSLDAQQQLGAGRSELAQGMLGRVQSETSRPFDWASMPQRANAPMTRNTQAGPRVATRNIDASTGDATRQRIEQGLLGRLRGERDYQTSRLESRLANQGLTPGSENYRRAMQEQNDQFSRDEFNALMTGGQEQERQFGMTRDAADLGFRQDLQSGQDFFNQNSGANAQNFGQDLQAFNAQNQNRQGAIGEQAMQRSMSLNELNSLLSGQQVGMPDMPDFNTSRSTGGTDYSGAGQQQYGAAMDQYNASQASRGGLLSSVAGLAGAALGGPLGGMLGNAVGLKMSKPG